MGYKLQEEALRLERAKTLARAILEDYLGDFDRYFREVWCISGFIARTNTKSVKAWPITIEVKVQQKTSQITISFHTQDQFGSYPERKEFSLADPDSKDKFQEALGRIFDDRMLALIREKS